MDWSGPERLHDEHGAAAPVGSHGVFRAIVTLEGETVVAVDAVIGYLHRCHEKLVRDAHLRAVPVDCVEDRLRRRDDERVRVRHGRGGDRQVRGAEARAVPAGDRRRAPADRVAPALARHVVHGHGRRARRRRDDLSLLHPRARADSRSLRVARRRAPAVRLLPGRRHALRHP